MADVSSQTNATGNNNPAGSGARMNVLLQAFRQVGMPLLQALTETPAGEGQQPSAPKAGQFGTLIDSTVALSRELSAHVGASEDQIDAWVRWSLAGAASQLVDRGVRL